MKPYKRNNIPFARELRKDMTKYEKKLWYDYLRSYPVRFQRQKLLGNYIADFYCAKAKLVIELDGSGHFEEQQEKADVERTHELNKMGITVLRFTNLQIVREFEGVCLTIHSTVEKLRGVSTDFGERRYLIMIKPIVIHYLSLRPICKQIAHLPRQREAWKST